MINREWEDDNIISPKKKFPSHLQCQNKVIFIDGHERGDMGLHIRGHFLVGTSSSPCHHFAYIYHIIINYMYINYVSFFSRERERERRGFYGPHTNKAKNCTPHHFMMILRSYHHHHHHQASTIFSRILPQQPTYNSSKSSQIS